jgi:hypothetical protein
LTKRQILLFCHSGLDPWFDRLTTLSKVEGESSVFFNVALLDAGSVMPDLIRDRHDGQQHNAIRCLNNNEQISQNNQQ